VIRKRSVITGILLGIISAAGIWFWNSSIEVKEPAPTSVLKIKIPKEATFGELTRWLNFPAGTTANILEITKSKYDLKKIVSGRELALVYDAFTGELEGLNYKIDTEEELTINRSETDWSAEVRPIPYEIKEVEAEGIVESSLYGAVVSGGKDERLALAIAEMFAWQVDFVANTRVGDTFKVIYEERYLNGEYAMPGKILAARYTNDGEAFYGYLFSSGQTKEAHYDQNGNSLQKEFLKSPLQYKYISSGYSLARVNPVTGRVAPHRGIDFAAPAGTPAVSIGDGTVVQAGWNGPYGISVLIRHNNTYQTRYGHFSRLAKGIKVGAKVKQGQVVGYVGSTGESTGPHLHYEMHKFGSHVNPFKVVVPPGEPVHESDKAAFAAVVDLFSKRLVE
jgi:murein DD-endopeptidase MepM/ murein hydrolase activator NlpD